jgi:hypothetical protein
MNAERVYRLLLHAYPAAFRAEYGREMELLFRDQCREGDVRSVGFWARVVWDVVRSAPALRVEATRTVEVIMRVAAILAVLLGALSIFGGVGEWFAGSKQAMSGTYVLAVFLGVFGSVLIIGAGIAILLHKPRAARLALIASLAMFVTARLLFPWMGIFAQLVGFGLPVVLLIALFWPRKSSTLGTASIVLMGLAVPQLCRAQGLPLGRWTGSAGTMDQPAAHSLTFDVATVGDSLRIMLHPNDGNDYRLDDIGLSGDTLRFTLQLARPMPRSIERDADAVNAPSDPHIFLMGLRIS